MKIIKSSALLPDILLVPPSPNHHSSSHNHLVNLRLHFCLTAPPTPAMVHFTSIPQAPPSVFFLSSSSFISSSKILFPSFQDTPHFLVHFHLLSLSCRAAFPTWAFLSAFLFPLSHSVEVLLIFLSFHPHIQLAFSSAASLYLYATSLPVLLFTFCILLSALEYFLVLPH